MHSALMKSVFSDEQSPGNRQYQLYTVYSFTNCTLRLSSTSQRSMMYYEAIRVPKG